MEQWKKRGGCPLKAIHAWKLFYLSLTLPFGARPCSTKSFSNKGRPIFHHKKHHSKRYNPAPHFFCNLYQICNHLHFQHLDCQIFGTIFSVCSEYCQNFQHVVKAELKIQLLETRREQYYWVGYWYWVILGCYWKLVLVLGIVKAFMQNWYWYWVLLKPFCKIGIGIGYC